MAADPVPAVRERMRSGGENMTRKTGRRRFGAGPEVSFPYDAPKRRRWSGPA